MNYNVHIENFDGPLDLLLHFVKETKMDIYEINMSEIIENYISYVQELQDLNINVGSEFLLMAASLVHLKSKMLLGSTIEEDTSDSEFDIANEDDLRQKILDYEKYKEICKTLKQLEEKRGQVYTKLPENLKEYMTTQELFNEDNLTVQDLVNAMKEIEKRLHYKEPIETKITRREYSVKDREMYIRSILREKRKCEFRDLFEDGSKSVLVVTFLAILEMCKQKEIMLRQENNFKNIMVEVRV